jgi:hypothetical protein
VELQNKQQQQQQQQQQHACSYEQPWYINKGCTVPANLGFLPHTNAAAALLVT